MNVPSGRPRTLRAACEHEQHGVRRQPTQKQLAHTSVQKDAKQGMLLGATKTRMVAEEEGLKKGRMGC